MADKVKEQILAIRDTTETNMFDTVRVQRMAYDRGFYELVLLHKKGVRPLHPDR